MNILIIGNPNSLYIKEYIKNVLVCPDNKIALSFNGTLNNDTLDFCVRNKIELIDIYGYSSTRHSNTLAIYAHYYFNLCKYAKEKKFDCIHIHYVGNARLMQLFHKRLKRACKKLIITFWGSDILDIDFRRAKQLEGLMQSTDIIVIPTFEMKKAFWNYYGHKFDLKIRTCLFGNPVIKVANELIDNDADLSVYLPVNIPKEKYVIALGYNASDRQQHELMIKAIDCLPDNIKNRLLVVLQMGYGEKNVGYIDKIDNIMSQCNVDYVILRKWMNPRETAALKQRVDLFIHGQMTDALSSSVLEYLYFKTLVFNPKWIKYKEWLDIGIKYVEFDKFDDIPSLVFDAINGKIAIPVNDNYQIIRNHFTWDKLSVEWKKLYLD